MVASFYNEKRIQSIFKAHMAHDMINDIFTTLRYDATFEIPIFQKYIEVLKLDMCPSIPNKNYVV